MFYFGGSLLENIIVFRFRTVDDPWRRSASFRYSLYLKEFKETYSILYYDAESWI